MIEIDTHLSIQLGEIADVTSGLVVKRREAKPGDKIFDTYKVLTLRSFDQEGWLKADALDVLDSSELIEAKYLSTHGDVIVRLSQPYTAINIDQEHQGYVIPSSFAIIRISDTVVLPEFLAIFLNSEPMRKNLNRESGVSLVQIIKASILRDVSIPKITLEKQKKVIELNQLMQKERNLLKQLGEEKNKLNTAIINQIIYGGKKNGE